ncbi:MAG: Gfo/Idh/MocA family oxidoreductase, partial [Candidatus Latescibacterota bacterium]|nr:Gfo/Idh/MocA family oxidoreductase [Candidatus Latescibacterota bacterium]
LSVRIGIVGTSWWADAMHLPSLKSHPGAQLVALCGRNQTRAAEMAAKYDIPQIFGDYREMIAKAELDALVISVPDEWHYPIASAALDAGLHLLCEKPLALNVGQASAMLAKAQAAEVVHMILFTYRWSTHHRYLHQLIEEGYIGRPYHGHWHFFSDKGRSGQYEWKYDQQRSSGALSLFGSHMIDMARWHFGEIARVSAHLPPHVERPGPDGQALDPANDSALLLVEFANGMHGTIHTSLVAHVGERGAEQHCRLHGESGTLEADFIFAGTDAGAEIRGGRHGEARIQPLPVPRQIQEDLDPGEIFAPFTRQSAGPRRFVDAILAGESAAPDFSDGLKAQAVIAAALEAHRTGAWVAVP